MGRGVVGIERESSSKLPLPFSKVPLIGSSDGCQGGVSFGEGIVDLNCPKRGSFRQMVTLLGCDIAIHPKHMIRVRQSRVSECVPGVFCNRLLEIGNRLTKIIVCSLVPEVAAFQVQLVCLWIVCVAPD